MKIINYRKITDHIHTSGQPKPEEFAQIKALGVETVINLAMPDSKGALADEGRLVSENGMNYVHIPVVWEDPKDEQFALFSSLMDLHSEKGVHIHCALNWRVSSFVFMYRTKVLGHDRDQARQAMEEIWQPNETWTDFMDRNG